MYMIIKVQKNFVFGNSTVIMNRFIKSSYSINNIQKRYVVRFSREYDQNYQSSNRNQNSNTKYSLR